jgi:hypothetical protein
MSSSCASGRQSLYAYPVDEPWIRGAFPDPDQQSATPPPHAAPARIRHENPLSAAERLLADSASELTDEQNWDTYAQIDEERQQARGSIALLDRLAANHRRSIQVRVSVATQKAFDVRGELLEVGDGWIRLVERGTAHVVRISAIVSISGLAVGVADPGAAANPSRAARRSWSSLLREIARESTVIPVRILRCDGVSLSVAIVSIGGDYIEIRQELGPPCPVDDLLLIPTTAIVMLTSRR